MADNGELPDDGNIDENMPINAEDNLNEYHSYADEEEEDAGDEDGYDDEYDYTGMEDGDYDDDDLEDDDAPDGSDDDGEESELVVLDPDHPLMSRFQNALSKMLSKQNERLDIDNRETEEALKKKKKQHEDYCNELYNIQQELAKQQKALEDGQNRQAMAEREKREAESGLSDVQRTFKDILDDLNSTRKSEAGRRQERDNLALRMFYMRNAKEDVRGDIAVMRRAAEKADTDLGKAEEEKMLQDLLVNRLEESVDRLREEIAMYDAQIVAQGEEKKSARDRVQEAQIEIDTIGMEKNQLKSQWHSSLIGLQRRNEAYSAMMKALHDKREEILSKDTEFEGLKKAISKEQEQNEKWAGVLNKTESDITTVKRLLATSQNKHDTLKKQYSNQTRMLQMAESGLHQAMTQKQLQQNEVNALRKQIEREYLEKVKLEDEITQQIRSRLTMKKAAQYSEKLTGKMRDISREMESQMALVENDISKDALEVAHTQAQVEALKRAVIDLDNEIIAKNKIITKSENEIDRSNVLIERKQGAIDLLNKKMEQMIANAGGVELGPLEITINSLQKSIAGREEEIASSEQIWLRDQHQLVQIINERDAQTSSMSRLKRQLTILSQKKMRIEGDIETRLREKKDIERELRHLQNDMQRLNGLIYREKDAAEHLDKANVLQETDFVRALREEEGKSIEMEEKKEKLIREKEENLCELIEAERQIMLWEKKIQLAQETRAAVDSDIGQGEIAAMKNEIHRMEVRSVQLKKEIERLVLESEKAVSRRDTIAVRGEAQTKAKVKVVTRGAVQREIKQLRVKIKQTIQAANECDEDLMRLRDEETELNAEIDRQTAILNEKQQNMDGVEEELLLQRDSRQTQIMELHAIQQTKKYYDQLKDGKYRRLLAADGAAEAELEKQQQRIQSMHLIVDRLARDFPQLHRPLAPVRHMISRRIGAPAASSILLSDHLHSDSVFVENCLKYEIYRTYE